MILLSRSNSSIGETSPSLRPIKEWLAVASGKRSGLPLQVEAATRKPDSPYFRRLLQGSMSVRFHLGLILAMTCGSIIGTCHPPESLHS